MPVLHGPRFHCGTRTIALKNTFATLIQRFAVALLHHLFQQAPHGFYPIHQAVEFCEFLPGERPPPFRSPGDIAETEEQLADFVQGKTELARPLDDCQAVERCRVVSSLPAHSHGGRKKSDSLVVANRGSLKPDLPGYFGNRQWRHDHILRLQLPECQTEVTDPSKKSSCLKVNFKLHATPRLPGMSTNSGARGKTDEDHAMDTCS